MFVVLRLKVCKLSLDNISGPKFPLISVCYHQISCHMCFTESTEIACRMLVNLNILAKPITQWGILSLYVKFSQSKLSTKCNLLEYQITQALIEFFLLIRYSKAKIVY